MNPVKLANEQKNLLSEIEKAGVEVQYFLSIGDKNDNDDYLDIIL